MDFVGTSEHEHGWMADFSRIIVRGTVVPGTVFSVKKIHSDANKIDLALLRLVIIH